MSDQLRGSDEENCLTVLCYSKENAVAVAAKVTPTLFSTRMFRWIAEAAITYIEKYHEPPGPHIVDLLETRLRAGEEGRNLNLVLMRMEQVAPQINDIFVIDNLDKFVEEQALCRAYMQGLEALQRHDLEAARAAAHSVMNVKQDAPGIWLHDPDQALRFLDQHEGDFFPSGVQTLDEYNVRPQRKTMFLIMAPAKSGKSFWLVEIGRQAIFHRRKVLHITLEMSTEEVAQRYVQALNAFGRETEQSVVTSFFSKTGDIQQKPIVRSGIKEQTRTALARTLRNLERRARLHIKEFPTASLTLGQLNAYLDRMEIQENFKPDIILLDYADLMSLDASNLRIDTGQLFKGLRGIAVERNVAMVTATQGNRISARARTVHTDMVAEDWSKIATADVVCTYNRTQFERDINMARIFVGAGRTVADRMMILITQSYATGQFCLDSRLLTAKLREAMEEMEHGDQSDGDTEVSGTHG